MSRMGALNICSAAHTEWPKAPLSKSSTAKCSTAAAPLCRSELSKEPGYVTLDLHRLAVLNLQEAHFAAGSLDAAKRIAECFGLEGNQALLSANSMVKSAIGVDLMEMAGVKRLVNESQEMNFTPTELGVKFGMSAVSMNKLLAECGLQHQVIYKPGKKRWEVTPDGKLFAVITDTGKKHSDGKPVQQILWKESVQEMLARLADQLRSGLPAVIAGGVRR